jgi:hypothetical protein
MTAAAARISSVNPWSRDLSHEAVPPFQTGHEGLTNPHLSASSTPLPAAATYGARMFGGQAVTFQVGGIPPLTDLMSINVDVVASQPGVTIPGITAPQCRVKFTVGLD